MASRRLRFRGLLASWLLLLLPAMPVSAAGEPQATLRIAFIDPQSGPFANIGRNILRTFQLAAERASAGGSVKYEVVAFDNKGSPQESLNMLKAAVDQGFRFIAQGNGSGAAAALLDAVNKHNARHPGQELVYLNYAAVDPDLTNARCSFWHFRFDADTSMKMEVMAAAMAEDPAVRRIYLINQDYAHGQQVSRYAKEIIARRHPAAQVVGDQLHPLGQVKDFAPYVAKIMHSGADTVVTGNWGQDLALLIKAAKDAGLRAQWYTYYAGAAGTPAAIGGALDGRLTIVSSSYSNLPGPYAAFRDAFRQRYQEDFSAGTVLQLFATLQGAVSKARSTDPLRVARAMEGLSVTSFAGETTMRAVDHQLQQPLFVARWQKADGKTDYDVEGTGHTFVLARKYPAFVAATPTSCQMTRP